MATRCKCGIALEDLPSRVVKKEGHNKGKWFKACNACGSFFWAPKQDPIAPEPPVTLHTAPPELGEPVVDTSELLMEVITKLDIVQNDILELRSDVFQLRRMAQLKKRRTSE